VSFDFVVARFADANLAQEDKSLVL
jgi:hypothetical protein